MYCQECGTKALEKANFCSECGRKLPRTGAEIDERPKRMYTIKTAISEYFQGAVGETKLREAIKQGSIPHSRIGVKIILREEALDSWMTEQEKLSMGIKNNYLQLAK